MNSLSVIFRFCLSVAFGVALVPILVAADGTPAPTASVAEAPAAGHPTPSEIAEHEAHAARKEAHEESHASHAADHAGGHHDHIGEKDVNKQPEEFRSDLAIFSAIVFGLLAAGMYFTAWPKILGALADREEGIRKAISDAEDAKVQAQTFMKEHKGRLEAVENQVKDILAEARRDAEHTKLDIMKQAEVEAEATKNRAIAEINRAKDQAIDELFSTLSHQVSAATEQVVGRALTGADQERLIQETVSQFARQKA